MRDGLRGCGCCSAAVISPSALSLACRPHVATPPTHPSRPQLCIEGNGTEGSWNPVSSFWAYPADGPALIRYNILDAHGPHRFKVSVDGAGEGWSPVSSFRAYNAPHPGTVKVHVFDAPAPHRFKLSLDGVAGDGWSPLAPFWAFDSPHPGTVRVNVLDAPGPHRFKVTTDGSGEGMGWSSVFSFWAYP